ncbi:MAG: hypothetical protein ACLGSH_05825 [Acidobacteriota bacterium]
MDEKILLSGWKLYVCVTMVVVGLAAVLFRFDEFLFRHSSRSSRRRKIVGRPPMGRPEFTDPDGRAWKPRKRR